MNDPEAAGPELTRWRPDASAAAEIRRSRVQTVVILFLAVVGLIVIGLRFVAFALFSIRASSIYPTLLIGDYVVVSKYSYGYSRYSVPFGPASSEGRIWESPVERGDVAVFRNPRDISEDYIKRIVGLPGDRIQLRKGILHINSQPVERERIEDFETPRDGMVPQYLETLPNRRVHPIIETRGDTSWSDNTREFTVPPKHCFAMGDNRDDSADSRVIGMIPAENLIGRAEVLVFSSDGFDIRFDRIFQVSNNQRRRADCIGSALTGMAGSAYHRRSRNCRETHGTS
jgi:signal peptidase I